MQMARKAAIKVLRKKLVGKDKAAKYSLLSIGQETNRFKSKKEPS